MSFSIPRPPLLIGLLGLIPFVYAALAANAPQFELAFAPALFVAEEFGLVIFAYMTGAFWGFAANGKAISGRQGWRWFGLAAAPAVVVILLIVAAPDQSLIILTVGFPALLPFDWLFQRAKRTPQWWFALRLLLTAIVTACLWLAGNGAGEAF